MTHEEAKIISKRIYEDSKSGAPDINHPGHMAYMTGSLRAKIEWILCMSDLKFDSFDEKGIYIPFPKKSSFK